ncbi:hypothetical protein [Frankia nepalensis]|uniref:hypothetical protein n=1 Tax=Frankia nepalensis TaxID=1836974 RepID=UPI0028893ACA|nr:hypothetical protein [Frankia nepalensis]
MAAALNVRMATCRVGQQELADLAGVSVATLRVLQRGGGGRRAQNATLAAVSRALGWSSDHLLRVLLGEPLPDPGREPAWPDPAGSGEAEPAGPRDSAPDTQAEILAVLRRIEQHVEGIARHVAPA